jgi:hypothetical protein
MTPSRQFGLLGGLGVGATVIYYQGLLAACVAADREPRTAGHRACARAERVGACAGRQYPRLG